MPRHSPRPRERSASPVAGEPATNPGFSGTRVRQGRPSPTAIVGTAAPERPCLPRPLLSRRPQEKRRTVPAQGQKSRAWRPTGDESKAPTGQIGQVPCLPKPCLLTDRVKPKDMVGRTSVSYSRCPLCLPPAEKNEDSGARSLGSSSDSAPSLIFLFFSSSVRYRVRRANSADGDGCAP